MTARGSTTSIMVTTATPTGPRAATIMCVLFAADSEVQGCTNPRVHGCTGDLTFSFSSSSSYSSSLLHAQGKYNNGGQTNNEYPAAERCRLTLEALAPLYH